MSLINDALKRATQSPASSPTAPPPDPATPMQHVEYRRGGLPWYFFPTLLVVLGGACWFLVKGVQATRQASTPLQVHAREPQPAPEADSPALAGGAPMPEFAPAVDNSAPAAPIPNRNFSLDDEPAASAPPAPAPAPAVPAETPKAQFKLQGIFFREANPSAMVNGKSVSVGSRVSGGTVRAITRDTVTLEADGQTTVLTLEQ